MALDSAADMDVSFRIGGAAFFGEARQSRLRVWCSKQRPRVPPRRPLPQHVDGGIEPDGDRRLPPRCSRPRLRSPNRCRRKAVPDALQGACRQSIYRRPSIRPARSAGPDAPTAFPQSRAIHRLAWSGKRAPPDQPAGSKMSRATLFLILLLLLIVGGAVLLSTSAREVPAKPIEVDVQP